MLNRVVRLTKDGREVEADLRHAELIVETLGLKDAKAVSTPGVALQHVAWPRAMKKMKKKKKKNNNKKKKKTNNNNNNKNKKNIS